LTEKIDFLLPDGSSVEIPEDGSMSLLAMGYTGLMAWRQKKRELQGESEEQND
jgi:hypothetical protein|tara:strand:- start:2658 stop:2816 length:159 start_codon:yes stop_codon:yes gene_type:complete